MKYDYEILILGSPVPQGRPRARRLGRFIGVYEDAKSRNAKENIAAVVRSQAPKKPLSSALQVDIDFYFLRPKNHYRTGKYSGELKKSAPLWHTFRPDIDNLRKLVMDSMTGIFWKDDSLICSGFSRKMYSETPRVEVKIKILNGKK